MYSPTMNRWLNYFDETLSEKYSKSSAFKEGYDDPTYMTFKIEFGDWGASILDKKIVSKGVSVFSASQNDYDALPIGLLNCPFGGIENESLYFQNNAATRSQVFNDANMYSAFQYLRSRNEDTRAKYLYYFVNGLMEIQQNEPYIFKKISGIDKLETFDPKSGQRLKTPAKITLECLEGLSLKIRTLLELYRKAAWDDVYQRWILPENMREFKMIIYIFERRTFHDVETIGADNELKMVYSKQLNGDIPVKAYECCPCEFDIADSQSWSSDYNSDFSGNEESSKIVINVKNVKTFFRNGLLNNELNSRYNDQDGNNLSDQIDKLMIFDLVENIERDPNAYNRTMNGGSRDEKSEGNNPNTDSIIAGNITVNGARALFLNKNILLEKEDNGTKGDAHLFGYSQEFQQINTDEDVRQITHRKDVRELPSYVAAASLEHPMYRRNNTDMEYDDDNPQLFSAFKSGQSLEDPVGRIKHQYQEEFNIIHPDGSTQHFEFPVVKRVPGIEGTTIPGGVYVYTEYQRAAWITTLVHTPSYDKSRSFWQNLGDNVMNILFGCRRQILVSGQSNLYAQEKYINMMDALFPQHEWYTSVATEGPLPMFDMSLNNELNSYRPKNTYQAVALEPERPVPPQQDGELLAERPIPVQNFDKLLPERQITQQNIDGLLPERPIDNMNFNSMDNVRDLPSQNIDNILPIRDLPNQPMDDLLPIRDMPNQQQIQLDAPLNISKYTPISQFTDRALPEQSIVALNPKENERNNDVQVTLSDPRKIPGLENITLADLRILPGLENVTLEDVRKIPEHDLISLQNIVNHVKPEIKVNKLDLEGSISKATEKPNEKLISLDSDIKKAEEQSIATLKNNVILQSLDESILRDKDDNKLKFVKQFADNADEIHNAFVNNIDAKREKLRELSINAVRALPNMDMQVIPKDEKEKTNITAISLMSNLDSDQIGKNFDLISLNTEDIRKLSFQTLIAIDQQLDKNISETISLQGLSSEIHERKNPNDEIQQTSSRSSLGKPMKMQGLSDVPTRFTNRDEIVY